MRTSDAGSGKRWCRWSARAGRLARVLLGAVAAAAVLGALPASEAAPDRASSLTVSARVVRQTSTRLELAGTIEPAGRPTRAVVRTNERARRIEELRVPATGPGEPRSRPVKVVTVFSP